MTLNAVGNNDDDDDDRGSGCCALQIVQAKQMEKALITKLFS